MKGQHSIETGKRSSFNDVDYILFVLVLAFSACIGVYYAIKDRKKSNTKEFLLAGGNMSPIPVSLSLLASFMSAITLLGVPAEIYGYTTIYFWIGLGYFFVVGGATHIFIPVFYKLKVTSAYEYLEHRFSKGVRTAGSLTFCTQMLLYMAIVLYAPSLALNAVTGFNLWGTVISVGVVCTLYTTLGGMKAVLWTDTFQVGMMFAGLFAILIRGSMEVGGIARAWEIAANNSRVEFYDFNPDPGQRHTVWSLVVGGTFTWIAIYGTNQAQVQRACTCPNLRTAQIAMWMNFPGLCLILIISGLIGIVMFAFYSTCDPISYNLISAKDQLLPLFVMDILNDTPGVPGLFVACLFSGALSTISSGLNSLSAVVLEDVIKAYISNNITERRATFYSKLLILIFGCACLALSYVASLLGDVLQAALSLFGMIGGPLLGLFTLGMIFPWANKWGAYTGLFSSLILLFWIGIGAKLVKPFIPKSPISTVGCNWNATFAMTAINATFDSNTTTMASFSLPLPTTETPDITTSDPLYRLYTLSYLWYSATAVLTTVVIGLIVSFITGHTRPSEVDPACMCPIFDIFFPFLPEKIRKPLRFGVNYKRIHEKPTNPSELPLRQSSSNDLENIAEDIDDKPSSDCNCHENGWNSGEMTNIHSPLNGETSSLSSSTVRDDTTRAKTAITCERSTRL